MVLCITVFTEKKLPHAFIVIAQKKKSCLGILAPESIEQFSV